MFFFPLLRGETFTEVANRQNELYPWTYEKTNLPPTLHFDQVDSFYPRQVFINQALRSGEFPLWNPYSFGGQPFHATQVNGGLLYPFRVILSLTVSPERVHDYLMASHMLLGGISMYLLLVGARLSFPGSLFGAIAWMLNSFMLSWMALDYYPPIHAWLPLGFLLTSKLLASPSLPLGIALAFVLALMYLGGNLLFVELSLVVLAGYGAYLFARVARARLKQHVALKVARELLLPCLAVLVGLLVFLGLVAVQLLPTLDLLASVGRTPLTYPELQSYRLDTADLIHMFVAPTEEVLHLRSQSYESDPYHRMLFLGTPTAVLFVLGFFARHPLAIFIRWLSGITLAVVLGTPIAWIVYKLLPGFDHFKPLGRALFLFNFAVATLSAFGLDVAMRGSVNRIRREPIARAAKITLNAVVVLLVLIVVFQMHKVGAWVVRHQPAIPQYLFPPTPLVRALGEEKRILPLYPSFYGSTAMPFRLRNATGYNQMVPSRTVHLWRVVQGYTPERALQEPLTWAFSPIFTLGLGSEVIVPGNEERNLRTRLDLLARLGITHVIAPPSPRPREGLSTLQQMYRGPDGSIYQVPGSLPPVYLSPACEIVDDSEAALRRVQDPAFNPLDAVIVEAEHTGKLGLDGPPATGMGGEAVVTGQSLNTITIRVDSVGENWLVVNECWDSGWRAEIDGVSAPVVPGNYAFRAVRVPPGIHTVEMYYEPGSFVVGRAISLLTLLATLIVGVAWLRRKAIHGRLKATDTTFES